MRVFSARYDLKPQALILRQRARLDGTIDAVLTDESKKWFLRAYGGEQLRMSMNPIVNSD